MWCRGLIVCAVIALASTADAAGADVRGAARHFAEGKRLYEAGRYAEAIVAFTAAHEAAPHPSALFNIARCHENLGDAAKALAIYRQALAAGTSESVKADIRARVARLRALPVKVFVSSEPPGASVTVDGAASAVAKSTPTVLSLVPGSHVVLLRREGHFLEAARVVVATGKEQTVQIKLRPLPAACAVAKPCPKLPAPAPAAEPLADLDGLHLHLSLLGAFAITSGRPFAGGPAVQLSATDGPLLFGVQLMLFPFDEESVDPLKVGKVTYDKVRHRWIMAHVEGGWAFRFDNFYLYSSLALGLSADRVNFRGIEPGTTPERTVEIVHEAFAFAWSLGGGIEVMATRWLSLGASMRLGMVHGERADRDRPGETERDNHLPFWTLASSATFHL